MSDSEVESSDICDLKGRAEFSHSSSVCSGSGDSGSDWHHSLHMHVVVVPAVMDADAQVQALLAQPPPEQQELRAKEVRRTQGSARAEGFLRAISHF